MLPWIPTVPVLYLGFDSRRVSHVMLHALLSDHLRNERGEHPSQLQATSVFLEATQIKRHLIRSTLVASPQLHINLGDFLPYTKIVDRCA